MMKHTAVGLFRCFQPAVSSCVSCRDPGQCIKAEIRHGASAAAFNRRPVTLRVYLG